MSGADLIMINDLLREIELRRPKMSKGQKKIADYIMSNYEQAAYMTTVKLGRAADVSESTVVRFAHSMGYSGYPRFHQALKEEVKNKLTALQRMEVSNLLIGEDEILVVSFGTSFNDSRRMTIGAIESTLAESFPDWSVRRGFTSQIIIDHVKSRDGVAIDNVGEALDRAVNNNVKRLVVVPTHLMNGFEYTDLSEELSTYADAFEQIAISEPLLTSDEDFSAVADAIVSATAEYDDGETAIVFMGHGTEADSNGVYDKMQSVLAGKGCDHYFIGTVEATPSVEDVLAKVQEGDYKRVVLEPLMVVAGDHANNDMAGDEEDSWKTIFTKAGYEVVPVLRGLGELEEIRDIYVAHAQAALDSLQ